MGAESEETAIPLTRLQRAMRWATDRPLRHVLLGIGFVALLLTAPFGGLASAPATTPMATRAVGEEFTAGPLTMTITKAVTDSDPSTAFGPAEGGAYVMVFATISSSDPQMVSPDVLRDSLRITNMDNLIARMAFVDRTATDGTTNEAYDVVPATDAKPSVYSALDATPLPTIGNGLTYEAVFIFQTADSSVPKELTLQTYDFTWRLSSLQPVEMWLDPTPSGTLTLPVQVKSAKAHEQKQSSS